MSERTASRDDFVIRFSGELFSASALTTVWLFYVLSHADWSCIRILYRDVYTFSIYLRHFVSRSKLRDERDHVVFTERPQPSRILAIVASATARAICEKYFFVA